MFLTQNISMKEQLRLLKNLRPSICLELHVYFQSCFTFSTASGSKLTVYINTLITLNLKEYCLETSLLLVLHLSYRQGEIQVLCFFFSFHVHERSATVWL